MEKLKLKVNAKVNLALDIVGVFDNGYHNLDMIMTSVDIADVICVEKCDTSIAYMNGKLCGESNTACKALRVLEKYWGVTMRVDIEKHIPQSAGLGGSSADASAVLWAGCRMFDLNMQEVQSKALEIGCDVPFMMIGGKARIQGVGEIIVPMPFKNYNLLIVQQQEGGSTGQVYANYDKNKVRIDNLQKYIDKDEDCFENVLQASASQLCPSIDILLKKMKKFAKHSFMTGSGSAVVGVFDTFEQAQAMTNQFNDCAFVQAVCSQKKGIEIVE